MINYPLYDAIHEKKHTSHKSNPWIPQSPFLYLFMMYALRMQAVLYQLEMQCTKILQLLYDVTDIQTLIKCNI